MSDPVAQDGGMNSESPSNPPALTSRCHPGRRARSGRQTSQLDFTLPLEASRGASIPPVGQRARAQWWFTQMRQIVADGRDFDAAGVF